jgi:hypothetical protein
MPPEPLKHRPSLIRLRSGLIVVRTPRIRRIIDDMLSMVELRQVEYVPDAGAVILKLQYEKQAGFVICEADDVGRHHIEIAKFIRWNTSSPALQLPIVTLCEQWTLPMVTTARDAGISEIIGLPITVYAFMRRFMSALYQERRFIVVSTFHGPDRRKKIEIFYRGPWRRSTDQLNTIS